MEGILQDMMFAGSLPGVLDPRAGMEQRQSFIRNIDGIVRKDSYTWEEETRARMKFRSSNSDCAQNQGFYGS